MRLRCTECGGEHLARGLCVYHYHKFERDGTLKNYSLTKYGTETESLPTRAKWEYDPPGGPQALIAINALNELKGTLKMNRHLTEDQKQRIARATSSQEIADIVAETSAPVTSDDALAKRIEAAVSPSEISQVLAQRPSETVILESKRKFPYMSGPDGFLVPIQVEDNDTR